MKILLVNDTSNNSHYGCLAVSNYFRKTLSAIDECKVYPIFNRQIICDASGNIVNQAQSDALFSLINWSDLVIINGEGTIHHGRAVEIETIIEASINASKPFFLVNSILQDYPRISEFLSHAESITLRDSKSIAYANELGISAERCIDAALLASFDEFIKVKKKSGTAMTDWHPEAPANDQSHMSHKLLSFEHTYIPFVTSLATSRWPSIINELQKFDYLITGRYHAALFSILAGTKLVLMQSNSHKMIALAEEYNLSKVSSDTINGLFYHLGDDNLDQSREKMISQIHDKNFSPLKNIISHRKVYPIKSCEYYSGTPVPTINREYTNVEYLRLLIDKFKHLKMPLSRKQRLFFKNKIKETSETIEICTSFAEQEDLLDLMVYIAECHAENSQFEKAISILGKVIVKRPNELEIKLKLAFILYNYGAYKSAFDLFKVVDKEKALKGFNANIAARAANRVGASQDAFKLLLGTIDDMAKSKPEDLIAIAGNAMLVQKYDDALKFLQLALQSENKLQNSQLLNIAQLLIFNGSVKNGFAKFAYALRMSDELLKTIRVRFLGSLIRKIGYNKNKTIYFPESWGVGSSVLALYLAFSGQENKSDIHNIIIDPRLGPIVKKVVGEHVSIISYAKASSYNFYNQIETVCDVLADRAYLKDFATNKIALPKFSFSKQSGDLRSRFPNKVLCGLAWYTPNTRSSSGRNISLNEVRRITKAFPDVIFVSLQPDNDQANFQIRHINTQNIFVNKSINPLKSIEDQLNMMTELNYVFGIDCSALHFAGMLGIKGTVLLRGSPTWQWPRKKSFYSSIKTAESLDESISHLTDIANK